MNLKEIANKLRKAADVLDELVGLNLDKATKNETKSTATKIIKKLKKNIPWQHRPGNEKKAAAWRKMMVERNRKMLK